VAYSKPVLVVHGGAWEIPDSEVEDHLRGMNAALEKGWSLLVEGASALNVIEEVGDVNGG
jgi:beta-aspartyl-peptidase (threonine type)